MRLSGGLRSRLVLLLLLTLVPVVAASIGANLRQRTQALDLFLEDARHTTRAITADLNRIVTNTRELMEALQSLPAVRTASASCADTLRAFLRVHPFLTNLGMSDANGTVVCAANPVSGSSASGTDWFERAVAERGFVIGASQPQLGVPQRELVFAHPVLADGHAAAVLFATFDLSWLDRLLEASSVANGAVGNVFDEAGVILYRSEEAEAYVGRTIRPESMQGILESDAASTDTAGLDGVRRRYVVAPWGGDRRRPLTLAVGYPTAAVLRPFNSTLLTQTAFLAIGVLVAILAVNRAAQTLVLGPLETLVAATARLRSGDLSTRVAPAGGPELQQLSEAFNLTVQTLQRSQALEEQLRDSQHLQSIGQLAGGVAHEFNNMLTVILGHADMMLEADPDREELQAIRDAALRSQALTQQLLAFSRRQLLRPKAVSLNELVTRVSRSFSATDGRPHELCLELADGDPLVMVDRTEIERVLLNLLLNAMAAIPTGGRITLATTRVRVSNGRVPRLADGDYVELSVADSGVGMDGPTLARALEPFFTTRPFGQGAGLGLSTAYGIIRQSGGELTLSSAPQVGTTVRIYLPACPAPASASGSDGA
jgi:signal transduction histidine kinase